MVETFVTATIKSSLGLKLITYLLRKVDLMEGEIDYLQIFILKQVGSSILIEHSQEVPYRTSYYFFEDGEDIIKDNVKLYLVYENGYRVLMFAEEY